MLLLSDNHPSIRPWSKLLFVCFRFWSFYAAKTQSVPLSSVCAEAFAAIYWLVCPGCEGNLGEFSALGAYGVKHLTRSSAFAAVPAASPAFPAAGGFVLETLFSIKFLFARCEGELSAAILADQHFVFKHDFFPFGYLALTSADLVFDPTLACWRVRYPESSSHYCLSRLSERTPTGLTSKPHHAHGSFVPLTWIALPATGIDFQPQTRPQ